MPGELYFALYLAVLMISTSSAMGFGSGLAAGGVDVGVGEGMAFLGEPASEGSIVEHQHTSAFT